MSADTKGGKDDGSPARAGWGNKLDFILTCLGFAVGLGNVWRFPYMAGKNGGAAFMVPYVIMMIFAGFPVFYIELTLGQFGGLPPHMLYRNLSPIFQGLGYGMLMVQMFIALYYNMVIGWAIYYLIMSFQKYLPFAKCDHSWNTPVCFDHTESVDCEAINGTYCAIGAGVGRQCVQNVSSLVNGSLAYCEENLGLAKHTPADEYWNFEVTHLSEGIDHMGYPQWPLVLCLAGAWFLIFCTLVGGIKTAGKVVYFTATFPYVIIIILIVRGCTLKGAWEGIDFYLIPKTEILTQAHVWSDAAAQIFFSLGISLGGLPTLASYNDFHNNVLRDTIIVVIGNCITSFLCGFAIFPVIGHLAYQTNTTVAALADQGVGLAFIAYPGALVQIPLPQLWSVLFFFMLLLLGISTQQVNVETLMTAIVDQFPSLRERKRRALATFVLCFILFVVGLCMTTEGGPYVVELFDKFSAGWNLIVIALLELMMVVFVYGLPAFLADIRLMMGLPPNLCWAFCGYPVNIFWVLNWIFITPALLIFVLVFNFYSYHRPKYNTEYTYPRYAEIIGWVMACSTILPVLLMGLWRCQQWVSGMIYKAPEDRECLFKPTSRWVPNNPAARAKRAAEIKAGGGGKSSRAASIEESSIELAIVGGPKPNKSGSPSKEPPAKAAEVFEDFHNLNNDLPGNYKVALVDMGDSTSTIMLGSTPRSGRMSKQQNKKNSNGTDTVRSSWAMPQISLEYNNNKVHPEETNGIVTAASGSGSSVQEARTNSQSSA